MSRSLSVHYIKPSSISIIPNANNTSNDLAIYVARETKIKVYSKGRVDMQNSTWQEWSISGRNRCLANSDIAYTIYARLSKTNKDNGYLVFAPKVYYKGKWIDKYNYLLPNGITNIDGSITDSSYWYVYLGSVSKPRQGSRSVDLDTGILGTDQYNMEWVEDPQHLPIRIETVCVVDDEDVGQTPYVGWGKSLILSAFLVKGWADTEVKEFDHWEITRNTGSSTKDTQWATSAKAIAFRETGTITLLHSKGTGDDFNGAVSTVFTIKAMSLKDDGDGYEELASTTVNIQAETVEKYEILLSSIFANFNPQSDTYTPTEGINVKIRATDQRGDVFELTQGQVSGAKIKLQYSIAESQEWIDLALDGTAAVTAVGNIPISVFRLQKNVDIRIISENGLMIYDTKSVIFVRDGADSKDREWIFLKSAKPITFGPAGSENPRPSLITIGEKSPTGKASGVTPYNNNLDDWVPQGWYDNPQGTSEKTPYEYASYRDYIRSSNNTSGYWGDFVEPIVWNKYAVDSVSYELIPSVSVIKANAQGVVTSEGIIVKAFRTKGTDRSGDLLESNLNPQSGNYYFAEYSIDGESWRLCGAFDYKIDNIRIRVYGIPPTSVQSAKVDVAIRLKYSGNINDVLKETTPIKVVKIITEEETVEIVKNYGGGVYLSKIIDDIAQGYITFLKGLGIGGEGLYDISPDGAARLKSLLASDMVKAKNMLSESLVGKSYTGPEILGDKGFSVVTDNGGYGHMITDYLTVRIKAIFAALEIRKIQYSSGNVVIGGAGSHLVEVKPVGFDGSILDPVLDETEGIVYERSMSTKVYYDKSRSETRDDDGWAYTSHRVLRDIHGNILMRKVESRTATPYTSLADYYAHEVAAWRCYAAADDGTTATMNDWQVGDQAQCRTFNIDEGYYEDVSNRYYWRLVVNTGKSTLDDGKVYTWVDLSNVLAINVGSGSNPAVFQPLYDKYVELFGSGASSLTFVGYHDYASAGSGDHGVWPSKDSKGGQASYGNDYPEPSDDIVQMGNQMVCRDDDRTSGRQGLVQIVATGEGSSSINIYAGLSNYNLADHKVIQQSPNGFVANSSYFMIRSVGDPTATSPVTCFRGDYSATASYGYYDVVYYEGSLWLCVSTAQITGQTPSDSSIYWTKFVSKGDKGADGGMWCLVSNLGQITLPNEDSRATLNDGSDFRSLTVTLKYDTENANLLTGELLVVSDGFYVDVARGSSLTPQQDNSYAIGSMIPVSTDHGGGNSTPNTGVSAVTAYVVPKEYYNDIYAYYGGYYWSNPKAVIALCEQLCKCKAVVPVVRVPAVETYDGGYSAVKGYAQSFDDFVTIGSGKMSFAQGDKVLVASPFIKGVCNRYGYPYYDSSLVPSDGAMCYVYDANMEVSNDPYKKNGHLFVARGGEWKDLGMLRKIDTPYSYMPLPTVVFREEWDDVEGRARKLLGTTQYVTPLVFDHEDRDDIYSVTVTDYYDSHGAGSASTPTPITSTPPFVVDYESATGRLKVTLRHRNVNGTDTLNGVPFVSGYCKITISWDRGEAEVTIPLYVSVARLGSYEASIQNDVYKSIASKTMVSPLDGSVLDFFTMIEQTSERLLFIQEGLRKCGISLDDGRIDLMADKVNFTTYALEPSERKPYIKVGRGGGGWPFLIFMNETGTQEMYNLGCTGLPWLVNNSVAQRFETLSLASIATGTYTISNLCTTPPEGVDAYLFHDGYTLQADGTKIWTHGNSQGGSLYDGKVYDSTALGSDDSPVGTRYDEGNYLRLLSDTTDRLTKTDFIIRTCVYEFYKIGSNNVMRYITTITMRHGHANPAASPRPIGQDYAEASVSQTSSYVTINNTGDTNSTITIKYK